jgi:hypothetical protein
VNVLIRVRLTELTCEWQIDGIGLGVFVYDYGWREEIVIFESNHQGKGIYPHRVLPYLQNILGVILPSKNQSDFNKRAWEKFLLTSPNPK